MELTAASFYVGATSFVVATLGTLKNGGNAFEIADTKGEVNSQYGDQRIRGVADLAQGDVWVFPPAAVLSDGPRKGG